MKKFIFDERNTMIKDGHLYELAIPPKDYECCSRCAFYEQSLNGICPGQCSSKNGDSYWIKCK